MSIRSLKNVIVDGEKSTLEVQLGERHIGDKCYTRVGSEVETWFENIFESREDILAQGMEILKKRLDGKNVTLPDGQPYDWK